MKKIKLNLDDLQVQSFQTTPEFKQRTGTVHGYTDGQTLCVDDPTCQGTTCGNTCETCPRQTCEPTCNDPGCVYTEQTCDACPTCGGDTCDTRTC